MIVGYIDNLEKERAIYPPILVRALKYLRDTDFSEIASGKHEIDGDIMFAIVQDYVAEEKEKCKPETHDKYIDIQFIDSGEEIIGYGNRSDNADIWEPYSDNIDITFYKSVDDEIDLKLTRRMYGVFFPWDVHRPRCMSRPGLKIRKVVVKLMADKVC